MSDPDDDSLTQVMSCEVFGTLRLHPWFSDVGAEEDFYSLCVKRAQAYGWTTTLHSAGSGPASIRWHHAEAAQDWSQDGRVRRLAALEVYPAAPRGQALPVLPMTQVVADCLGRVGEVRVSAYRYGLPVHLAAGLGADVVDGDAWFALSSPGASVRAEITAQLPLSVRRKVTHALREQNALHPGPVRPASPSTSGESPALSWTWPVRLPEWSPSAVAWTTSAVCEALRETDVRHTAIRVDACGGDSPSGD
ncbi:hypothetical protein GTY78_11470 [Streptomyces sp. SID4934]|uniref:hypothetical protein n=1 Tax=unclassified Streptomyces TaxID=2593676 RepID=UPI00081F13B2|nr:hypothetical protein [Streptomyces sp. ScaeMP-6W]MYQ71657.1 hypothetical protein [Streptomyces sp. SID4934]SCD81506.1 hypothetical protein GA0115237_105280 [Streptomyces sp. ScaeMP-6W]